MENRIKRFKDLRTNHNVWSLFGSWFKQIVIYIFYDAEVNKMLMCVYIYVRVYIKCMCLYLYSIWQLGNDTWLSGNLMIPGGYY